jgi:UDP:flavonoid glycosyltransferase YjiC (YdhE family)
MAQKVVSMEAKLLAVFSHGVPVKVAALCGELGISRQTLYKYQRRFEAEGPAGLVERSRRPHSSPQRISAETENAIIRLRKELRVDCGAQAIAYHLARHGEMVPVGPLTLSTHTTTERLGCVTKFALACYGTRGEIEPCAAVGRELLRRGHEVRMAVPPDLVGFVEAAGLATVAYGPDSLSFYDEDFLRNFWTDFLRNFWTIRDPIRKVREVWQPLTQRWGEMSTTLTSLADGADLLLTAVILQEAAANVAEYYDIPLATLHHFPMRANGQLVPILPSPLIRSAMTVFEWLYWRMTKKVEDAQRRELGLPKATGPSPRRITERGSLEIQAYDEVCFPGLAAEWAKWNGRRPFVGALTVELTTDADDEVASWIAAGTPPICFAFGSIPVESPADTVAMISAVCAELGQRALVCAGWSDFSHVPHFDHVKAVGAVNYAAIFPACRAVVHHGGSGTTAASLRAGVPTLIFWATGDQPYWGAQVKRLKVGTARRFSTTTQKSLVADLRRILAPHYVTRAREIARMTKPAESAAAAADLLENFARLRRFG